MGAGEQWEADLCFWVILMSVGGQKSHHWWQTRAPVPALASEGLAILTAPMQVPGQPSVLCLGWNINWCLSA